MKVIIVKGEEQVGKTTAINLIYGRLRSLGAKDFEPRVQSGRDTFDFKCVMSYTNLKNKHFLIALSSMGDKKSWIKNELKDYNGRCDYIVIACRPSFETDILRGVKTNYDENPCIETITDMTKFRAVAEKIAQKFETFE